MALAPSNGSWMNLSDTFPAPSLTPKPSQLRTLVTQTPTKTIQEVSEIRIELKKVLGCTSSSASGFDCDPAASRYAFCAGSTAVVAHVDDELRVIQKFFRAPSNLSRSQHVSSSSDPSTAPQTPEPHYRKATSLRRRTLGIRSTASPQIEPGVSPGRANIRQKTRAASCVAFSPDGKYLAVGETGYNPRILIFSLISENSTVPLACLTEHTFGVRCLAFSNDSRWLCSIGDLHDGFIYLWAINPKNGTTKLHSSNKCISFVQDIAWMGSSIVTVGTRHVKLWRPDHSTPNSPSKTKSRLDYIDSAPPPSPGLRTLPGRNCLLGPLIEATFTCTRAISGTKAVICTERGAVCILDDGDRGQKLYKVVNVDFSIKCMAVDRVRRQMWVAGTGKEIRWFTFEELEEVVGSSRPNRSASNSTSSLTSVPETSMGFIALGCLPGRLLALDIMRCVRVYARLGEELVDVTAMADNTPNEARAHACPVLGVDLLPMPNPQEAEFFTWSSDGTVIFWSSDGFSKTSMDIPLEQLPIDEDLESNEIAVVRASNDGDFFVSGDKIGVLRVSQGMLWDDSPPFKAHQSDINDISVVRRPDLSSFIATCGRDRTVQIFELQSADLGLMQTIEHHGSSVIQALFIDEGSTLLSSSSDRTVVVHQLATTGDSMAFLQTRIITLKSTPISMTLGWNDPTILVVSTIDRQIFHYELSTGRQMQGMHLIDNDTNESMLLDSIRTRVFPRSTEPMKILVGVSSTDKSVRIIDFESGTTIAKDYGHSDGISGIIALSSSDKSTHILISTGLDGTVMLWSLRHTIITPEIPSLANTPTFSQPPLRRVISRSALSEYQRSLEANGIPPMALTPGRSQSPSRLKKKSSRSSLAPQKLIPITLPSTPCPPVPRRHQLTQSPTVASPTTPTISNDRARPPFGESSRTKSASNLNDLNTAAEQLCRSLRAFRKQLAASSHGLKMDVTKDLEKELGMAARALGPRSERRKVVASETDMENLLGDYSERLARMVEEKLGVGTVGVETDTDETGLNGKSREVLEDVESPERRGSA